MSRLVTIGSLILLLCSSCWPLSLAGQSDQIIDDHRDPANWADAANGATITAGPHTRFLGQEDLRTYSKGGSLIFRPGPRQLEKVLRVEMRHPVRVRTVSFDTSYDDLTRVPERVDVYLSTTGDDDSHTLACRIQKIRGSRTLAAVDPPRSARFVKFVVQDSGQGARVSGIGVFTGTRDVIDPGSRSDETESSRRLVKLLTNRVKTQGAKGDVDLTICCGGSIEYSSPPPSGAGDIKHRFWCEDGLVKRKFDHLSVELPVYRALGATAMESYVRWNLVEEKRGVFDFSLYDAYLDRFQEHGLKWVPVVLAGPAYTLPDWFIKSPDFTPYRCLEHGEDSGIASIWNPWMRPSVDRFLKEFCRHYGGRNGTLRTLMLGVSGDYGEDLYPHNTTGEWTTNAHGDYHTHEGWWAGDRFAVADFRRFARLRYKSLDRLNAAWDEGYTSFGQVAPRVPDACKTLRARFDMVDWYNDSMTRYVEFWLMTSRKYLDKYMPGCRLLLSVGGHGLPRKGGDFTRTARLAAKYGAGVRVTNECEDYAQNFAMTRWISAACRLYGAWLGIEPASLQIDASNVAKRVFNVRTSAAEELFCYPSGLSNTDGYEKLAGLLHYLKHDKPTVSVAYWIPRTHMMAVGEVDYLSQMRALRSVTDFDAVDGVAISDGALDGYDVLVMGRGCVEEASVLEKIRAWVDRGGLLIRTDPHPLTSLDGSEEYQGRLFAPAREPGSPAPDWADAKRVGDGRTLYLADVDSDEMLAATVRRLLSSRPGPSGKPLLLPPPDCQPAGIYASLMSNSVFVLNTNSYEVTTSFDLLRLGTRPDRITATIPANSILSKPLPHR